MKNLKVLSVYEITKNAENIRELLSILDANVQAQNVADNDPNFWISTLPRMIYCSVAEELILLRGDFKNGLEWRIFYEDLMKGNSYSYSWWVHGENDKGHFDPTYAINSEEDHNDAIIQGTLPLAGTPTVFIMIWNPNNGFLEKNVFVFGSSNRDAIERSLRWSLDYIMNVVLSQIIRTMEFILGDLVIIISKDSDINDIIMIMTNHIELFPIAINMIKITYMDYNKPREYYGITISNPMPFPEY